MMRSLWTAASGMKAQQTSLDIAQRIGTNINTTDIRKRDSRVCLPYIRTSRNRLLTQTVRKSLSGAKVR